MRKINKTDRAQNKLDEFFRNRLRHNEVVPHGYMWDNIESQLNVDREKAKFDHWYYLILIILIPFTVANVLLKYDLTGGVYNKLSHQLTWLYTDEPEFGFAQSITFNNNSGNNNVGNVNLNNEENSFASFGYNAAVKSVSPSTIISSVFSFELSSSGFTKENNLPASAISDELFTNNNNNESVLVETENISHNGITIAQEKISDDDLINYYSVNDAENIIEKKLNNLKGIYLGGDVRVNNSWFLLKKSAFSGFVDKDVQYNFEYDLTYAVSLGYNFSKNIGLETEFTLSRQGQSYTDNSNRKVPIEGNISLTYFQLPVMFKYKWAKVSAMTQNPMVFNILIGPVYSRLVQSDYKVNYEQFDTKNVVIPKNEIGLTLGLEYDVYMTNNTYFTIGTRTGVSTDVKSFPYVGPNKLKTLNLYLGIDASVNFQLRPKQKKISESDLF
jgi:hypothetical protein